MSKTLTIAAFTLVMITQPAAGGICISGRAMIAIKVFLPPSLDVMTSDDSLLLILRRLDEMERKLDRNWKSYRPL